VSATASFSVDTRYIDDSKRVAWNDSALIKTKSILHFSLAFVHETFCNFNAFTNNFVCVIFNVLLLLFRERLVVCNVKMGLFNCLFCTGLPDMWPKYFPCTCKHNMSASMMSEQLKTAFKIYLANDFSTDYV